MGLCLSIITQAGCCHRRLKLRTDGGYAEYARVHELGSIDLFVVTSLKMNQLPPNFEHKFSIMYGILTAFFCTTICLSRFIVAAHHPAGQRPLCDAPGV